MAKIDILVGGTARTFAPDVPVKISTPELALQFETEKYNLVPAGKCKFLVSFNHEKKLYCTAYFLHLSRKVFASN